MPGVTMNILMMTNTYSPHLGGVARSVAWFTEAFRQRGHRTVVVAPTFPGMPEQEEDVIRVPAIQKFNGSDFSVRLPNPALWLALQDFHPDIVHSHHPFLMGGTALRVSTTENVPLVFTHHTMYERYTHYVPGDSPAMQRFAMQLATEYANLCDHTVAPSESIAEILRERGVHSPITVVPTGIDPERFAEGDGAAARGRYSLPKKAFVVGHVGRLAAEKNLGFLAQAVASFIAERPDSYMLVVGEGPSRSQIEAEFEKAGMRDRLKLTGSLDGQELADAYHAMDVFAFASHTETQGMALAEAMTAGVPVVAVDAPGAREVVHDQETGRLLPADDPEEFSEALAWIADLPQSKKKQLGSACKKTADEFSMSRCAKRMLELYDSLIGSESDSTGGDELPWDGLLRRLEEEWNLLAATGSALGEALKLQTEGEQSHPDAIP